MRRNKGKREVSFLPRRTGGIREFPFSAAAPAERRAAMGIWRKQKKEVKVEQEESGTLLSVKLSKKSGEPNLGVSLPKSEDRVKKLRVQSKELRGMAERLDLMADEMERQVRGGKVIRLFQKMFRRGAWPKTREPEKVTEGKRRGRSRE